LPLPVRETTCRLRLEPLPYGLMAVNNKQRFDIRDYICRPNAFPIPWEIVAIDSLICIIGKSPPIKILNVIQGWKSSYM
jgi:hypothetical protein